MSVLAGSPGLFPLTRISVLVLAGEAVPGREARTDTRRDDAREAHPVATPRLSSAFAAHFRRRADPKTFRL
jgi:hypothetical protein